MPQIEHLPNAPIAEALLDIRVRLAESATLDDLDPAADQVADQFPTRTVQRSRTIAIEGPEVRPEPIKTSGYLLESPETTSKVQFRLNGFTYNLLRPYSNWEEFCGRARHHWDIYREIAKPERVTRLAIRYINAIRIPGQQVDLEDYFTVSPRLPQALEERCTFGYFLSRVTAYVDDEAIVNVVLTSGGTREPNVITIILDIDAFMEIDEPPETEIWERMNKLRDLKNEVFFASITDKTEALCL